MTEEELKANIDEYVKGTCIYYRSTHEDILPNQFEKYLRSACVHFATEATKELEKENDDLCDSLETQDLKISELEQENAELKARLNAINILTPELQRLSKEKKAQLTKAKKLLKKVVTDFHNMDRVTVHIDKTIAEAEQFLKEVENKE